MSIENGVTTGAPHAAAHATTARGPGKARAGGAEVGGFAALLQDLGGETLPVQDGLAAGGDALDGRASDADRPADPAAATATATMPPAADAGAGAQAQPAVPADAGQALTAALHQSGQPGESDAAAARVAPARSGLARVESQPVTTSPKDGEAEPPVLLANDHEARPTAGELQPLLRQAALAQRMAQQRQQADVAAAQAVKEQRSEDMAARLGWQVSERVGASGSQAPQILLAAATAEGGVRPLERRHEKSDRDVRVGEALAWSSAAQADGPRLDVPAAAPDAGLMTEMRVAEQVSYWAGRGGVQNAELQVDGLGEGPVKVSIALQGQEARVEFRADQVQTRQVLEDSMPHLRELLAREGLVLAGVSVGTSGSDGAAGRQPQEGRKGARDATVAVPELPAVARPATRGAVLSGRSVDLFV